MAKDTGATTTRGTAERTDRRAPVDDAMTRRHAAADAADAEAGDETGAAGDDDDAGDAEHETRRSDPNFKPDFQEAFRLALDEHSTPAGKKKAAAEHAQGTGDSTEVDEAEGTPGAKAKLKKGTATTTEEGLLTDAEYTALETKHKDDPKALRRALEGAFTQKTQKLAADRASLERLTPYTDLVDALESTDEGVVAEAIRTLAKEYGVELTVKGAATATERAEIVEDKSDELLAEFRKDLGPDLDYLADGLMPAVKKMVERLAGATVTKEVKPLKDRAEKADEREAIAANEQLFTEFSKLEPNWKDHEDKMFELSQKLGPSKGMKPLEYLKALHRLAIDEDPAARETAIEAEVTKRLEKRVNKTSRAAAEVDERVDDVGDRQVRRRGPALPSFDEAAKAAIRGERFED